jgi:hypothetical protein
LTADFETASKSLGIPNARHLKMQTEFFAHLHQIDALAGVNGVQRQMVGIFEHNLAVCDPWPSLWRLATLCHQQNFTGSILPFAIHQLFFFYFTSKIVKRFERKLRSPSRGKG